MKIDISIDITVNFSCKNISKTRCRQTSQTLRQVLENQVPLKDCGENLPVLRTRAASKIDNDVICCYDDSDVSITLLATNFDLCLKFKSLFHIFVNRDVVNTQTWKVLALKNSIRSHLNSSSYKDRHPEQLQPSGLLRRSKLFFFRSLDLVSLGRE